MDNNVQCMNCMEFYADGLESCPFCGYSYEKKSRHALHMQPGSVLNRRYLVGETLGYGSFGVTYIAWDRLMKRKVAIKEYLPSENATRMLHSEEVVVPDDAVQRAQFEKGKTKFRQEAEKLAKLGDVESVVYVFDTFEANTTAYIVMEYLEGESLADYLDRVGILSEAETLDLMIPVLQALSRVHEKEIIHRDISPDSIYVVADHSGNRKLKLIDFGAARYATTSHSKSLTVLLRPGYSPEEQYRSAGEQGAHSDVYAVAAVMYQMVTGVRPIDALERRTSIERKKKDLLKAPSVYNDSLSENFETALMNALNVRIEDRTATADAFISELISFEKVERRGSKIRYIEFFQWPLWAKFCVPAAGVAAVVLIVGLGTWISGLKATNEFVLPENYTRVMDVIGMYPGEAKTNADEVGLLVEYQADKYAPDVEYDRILAQDIEAGRVVPKNTVLKLTRNGKTGACMIPDFTGMKSKEALEILQDMGIAVEVEVVIQPGLAPKSVVRQSAEPFSVVNAGSDTVILYVTGATQNSGGRAIDLCGHTYEQALQMAAENGICMVVSRNVLSRDVKVATILKQIEKSETRLNGDDEIHVVVARPWPQADIEMPNLKYKEKEIAVNLMKAIGIPVKVEEKTSEVVAEGLVIDQSEKAGTVIELGTAVVISVCAGTI